MVNYIKYNDVISLLLFGISFPLILSKMILFAIPTTTLITSSVMGYDGFAKYNFVFNKKLSLVINKSEQKMIQMMSFMFMLLKPQELYDNYKSNRNVIKFFRENVVAEDLNNDQIGWDIRSSVKKMGLIGVSAKMLLMFSFFPTFRHTFLNNPFLFKYKFYLTCQSSSEFVNTDTMCKVTLNNLNNPDWLVKYTNGLSPTLHQLGFAPNYPIDKNDNGKKFSNIGMQVTPTNIMLLYLNGINRTPEKIYDAITKNEKIISIMDTDNHPIYKKINKLDTEIVKRYPQYDNMDRIPVIDLVVPYDDMYHVVTGKVEENIRNGNIVEHPMLSLYHDGFGMKMSWKFVDSLFDNVMTYKNMIGDNYDKIVQTI